MEGILSLERINRINENEANYKGTYGYNGKKVSFSIFNLYPRVTINLLNSGEILVYDSKCQRPKQLDLTIEIQNFHTSKNAEERIKTDLMNIIKDNGHI